MAFGAPPWAGADGVFCMNIDRLRGLSKKDLTDLARKSGVAGSHDMTKDQLVKALVRKLAKPAKVKATTKAAGKSAKAPAPVKASRPRHQPSAARNTSNGTSAEEQVERSKYDVGVPTKDLSAKVPKHLPAGYGKDRIVVMVRDPYWLHAYWELTRNAIARAETSLGQEWHGAKPILRLLDVSAHDTTST